MQKVGLPPRAKKNSVYKTWDLHFIWVVVDANKTFDWSMMVPIRPPNPM